MNTTELYELFRTEVSDLADPPLFAPAAIYAYIDEAQKQFCRLTEGIEDGRSFSLSIVPDVDWYALDKRILKVRKAYRADTGLPLNLVAQEKAEQNGIRFDGRSGPVKALVTGIEKGMVRAWPVPAQASTVLLDVFRLPKTVGEDDKLEVDEQHHLSLLDWVKYRAYNIDDAETFDRRKSELSEARFRAYCTSAAAEQGRARHSAGVVAYGGY